VCKHCGNTINVTESRDVLEKAKLLVVEAAVRYWEDAKVNGIEDSDGTRIPLRNGELWKPVIELSTGRILDWPEGMEAHIHYKVCDEGEYWLADADGNRIAKWKDYYVPDHFLCVDCEGWGDYIILDVGQDGLIKEWKQPTVKEDEWNVLTL